MSVFRTIAVTAAGTFATVAALAISGLGTHMSKPIETRIEIAAPPSAVWTELADHAAYAVWNPFITRISGDLAVGERLAVIVQPQGKAAMEFAPEILIADADEELRWVGQLGMKGVFDGEHYFVLEETARGTTVFHHGERFSGLLTYLLFPLIGESTENGFHAMNLALKTRVEARSRFKEPGLFSAGFAILRMVLCATVQ